MKTIDVHAHLGKFWFPIERTGLSDILSMLEKNGIEKCILSSVLAIAYDFQAGNREVAHAIQNHEQLLGYIFVNPNYVEESLQEIKIYFAQKKFVGLKLYADGYISQPLNCEGHKRLLELVSKEYPNKLILCHCWYQSIPHLTELAKEFSNLKFLMGHMGGPKWEGAISAAKEAQNIYLEICFSPPERSRLEDVVSEIGAERVLFGSDLPLFNPAFILGMVDSAEITREEKELILYHNAKKMLEILEV